MQNRRFRSILCALLALAMLPLAGACSGVDTATGNADIIINEVVSSNKRSLTDEAFGSPDWIELFNAGQTAVDLSGWGLTDNVRKLHKFTFPEGTTIQAGGYLVVYATDNESVTESEALTAPFGLSKSGDYLLLTDSYYGEIMQLQIPALFTDVSYARADDGSFGFCAVPTPSAANTEQLFSTLDEVYASSNNGALVISEVMPNNDDTGFRWVELHNQGDVAVALENYCLSDTDTNLTSWQFPTGTVPTGGFVCVFLSGLGKDAESGTHTTFKLGKEDASVLLSDSSGKLLDRIDWTLGVPDGISVVKDAGGAVVFTAYPTFEAANSERTFTDINVTRMDASDPVRINEALKYNAMSAADSDGDRSEWVELKNFSGQNHSLSGYFLSDDPDDLYKWALPDVSVGAGGYLLVYLSGKNRTQGELHASFRLSDEENELYLTTLDGMRSDCLLLGELTRDDVSVGLDSGGNLRYFAYPTPGYENAKGFENADSIGFFNNNGVFISEVCAFSEPKSGENDWIELYNGSSVNVDLTGWRLSDRLDEPARFTFGQTVIAAGEHLVVEATSHTVRQNASIAPFGISAKGEKLLLTNAAGEIVDVFDTGSMTPGISAGRVESDPSVARVYFEQPTRGETNDADVRIGVSAQPVISETGLYHSEPFEVTISCADPNAVIYYTLDGDEPSYRSHRYEGPITISSSTPLRAFSETEGKRDSEITTATYLFVEMHTVPVVCISGEPARIREVMRVDDKDEKVERLATISYYEADGTLGTVFPAGIKPKGAGTVAYAQKSLSINLRAGYGQSSVTYPFWDDYEFTTFSALVVRNGGQDWGRARIRDSFVSRLVEGMYIDNSATRPVVVYINGEYNGLYDLNEDQNAEFLVTHYGVDGDTVDFIRRNSTVIKGGNEDIKRVRQFAWNENLKDDAVFEQFSQWVDVEYFTDYLIAQTYICNSDMFNQKYWRTQDYALKWRPVFYDLDFAFNSVGRDIIGQYFNEKGVPSADKSLTYFEIYIGLKKNAAWRAYCAERYVEVVTTYFNSERATALFDEMAAAMRPEMPRQISKWRKPYSMKEWENELSYMRDIVERRPAYALQNMCKYFGVSQSQLDEWIAKYSA